MKHASNINPPSMVLQKGKRRRDSAAILAMMQSQALSEGQDLSATSQSRTRIFADTDISEVGLTLGQLEDRRWSISPSLARLILENADLPYEGRRAGNFYSWRSIFRVEGIPHEVATQATRKSHPELFDDLLDTTAAAELMGYQDSSSIRKKVASGEISRDAYITFGRRGVYRFRPAMLIRRLTLTGKIL